jgi:hypothetical protein
MKKLLWLFVISYLHLQLDSQINFLGNYEGNIAGERVYLVLQNSKEKDYVEGEMTDSENKYIVNALINGNTLIGTAKETTWGFNFDLDATLEGNQLITNMTLNFLGLKDNQKIVFQKLNSTNSNITNSQTLPKINENNTLVNNPVSNKPRDSRLVGSWYTESNYSSGHGFNNTYGSMSTKETTIFLADGRIAEGEGQTVISGADYFGSAESQGQILPNVFWYTENNFIFVNITEEGKNHNIKMGRYYIEDNKLLITLDNGERKLFIKH